MKDDDANDATPSPYQNAGDTVETTEVFYFSPSKGKGVFLGKTIKKISADGKTSYTLLDPGDRIVGPDLPDEETTRDVWMTIAQALEQRKEELSKHRKKDDREQSKEH